MGDWVKINTETRRVIKTKSDPHGQVVLNYVTHYKKREHGFCLKYEKGIAYFEENDISFILSDVDDWVV
jgi:hypothetical protein